jgi:hypothetical protein
MERYQTKPVAEWSKKEVKAWLEALDLKEYVRAFRKHDVCGSRLVGLSREDLRAMNVTKVGHIKKITSWLRDSAALHNGYAPPSTTTSPTLSPTTSSSSVITSSGKFMATITRRYSFGGVGDSPVQPPPLSTSAPSSVVGATLVQSMARLGPSSRHTSSTLSTTSSSPSASSPPSPTRRTKVTHSSSSSSISGSPLRQSSMDIVCRRETRSASVPENLHSQQFFDVTVSDDVKFYSPETSGECLSLGSEGAVPLPRKGGGSGIRGRTPVRKSNSPADCNSGYARLYPSVYLWVKLVFDDDISILRFKRRSITMKRLQREILRIHQCQLRLRWVDSDGDCIEIKTTEFLTYALEDWQRRFDEGQQRMIRIEAFQKA